MDVAGTGIRTRNSGVNSGTTQLIVYNGWIIVYYHWQVVPLIGMDRPYVARIWHIFQIEGTYKTSIENSCNWLNLCCHKTPGRPFLRRAHIWLRTFLSCTAGFSVHLEYFGSSTSMSSLKTRFNDILIYWPLFGCTPPIVKSSAYCTNVPSLNFRNIKRRALLQMDGQYSRHTVRNVLCLEILSFQGTDFGQMFSPSL